MSDSAYNVETWEAFIIGILTGIAFYGVFLLIKLFKIDDPLFVIGGVLLPGILGAFF